MKRTTLAIKEDFMPLVAEAPRPRVAKEKRVSVPDEHGTKVVKSVTIHRNAQELYEFWRRFENLPLFMRNLVSVSQTSDTDSHWIARSPTGKKVTWDATIINEHPGELIAWRT